MAFRVGFDDVVIDTSGNALSNVEVSVYKVGTSELQTIYNERTGGTTKTNPFTTSSNGRVSFYIESPLFDVRVKDLNVPERFTGRTVTIDRVTGGGESAQILVSNASGLFVPAKLSGDATISNSGVLTVANESITAAKLATNAKPVTWYTPKIIAAEESRTNTAFGTLATADEIKEVVLPVDGLLVLGYSANFKSSVSSAGKAAIFLGSNQLKANRIDIGQGTEPIAQEAGTSVETFHHLTSYSMGLVADPVTSHVWKGDVTTGQALGTEFPVESTTVPRAGLCHIFAAAGTYNVSIQFKATSGSVTAKERKMWIAVMGN